MTRGLPVVAYGAAAIPGTIGDGGLVLARKDPAYVAAAVHALLTDHDKRSELVAAGRSRGATFTLANAEEAFRRAIALALEAG
jgi:glycosyltransferase involved in cell wall biosynthesis